MNSTENSISNIVAAISINEIGQLFFAGRLVENNFYSVAQNRKKEIIQSLSTIAYEKFYCTAPLDSDRKLADESEIKQFRKKLLNTYNPEPTLNKGWQIIEKENNGISYLQKQNEVIRLAPGQFIMEYDELDEHYQRTGYYSSLVAPAANSDQNYFHFIHGLTPNTGTEHPLVRFYFHLRPEGAAPLIQQITHWFNLFKIGFNFKCCANPNNYTRTDSAVLYIANHYFSICLQLLEKIIPEIKIYLREETPLFALRLANGISFAENPHNDLSFGESRCNIIAEGIYECVLQKLNQELYTDFIINKIKAAGYNINAMHLNPGSTFPYNFSFVTFE